MYPGYSLFQPDILSIIAPASNLGANAVPPRPSRGSAGTAGPRVGVYLIASAMISLPSLGFSAFGKALT